MKERITHRPESGYMVNFAGVVTRIGDKVDNSQNLKKFDGVYKISEDVLRRMKMSELAVYGKGKAEKLYQYLITLTFPIEFQNPQRTEINDLFKDLARKKFPAGGMWFTEVHTGEDYVNRKGLLVKGNPDMIGRYHYHYKVITEKQRWEIVEWVRGLQERWNLATNSINVSLNSEELTIYAAAYSAKKKQKAYLMYGNRPWASWGIDKEPVKLSRNQLVRNFTFKKVETFDKITGAFEKNVVCCTGNEYPVVVYNLKKKKKKQREKYVSG